MDHFTEYIVKQKTSKIKILVTMGMIIAVLAVWILSLAFASIPIISSLVILIDAGAVYNIEYEYCVTNGDMDVDKIINRRKRKRITSLKFSDIEIMAPVGYEQFKNEENGEFAEVIMAAISPDHPDAYYIIYDNNGKRTKLIFNPTQKIVEIAKVFAPRKVHER